MPPATTLRHITPLGVLEIENVRREIADCSIDDARKASVAGVYIRVDSVCSDTFRSEKRRGFDCLMRVQRGDTTIGITASRPY